MVGGWESGFVVEIIMKTLSAIYERIRVQTPSNPYLILHISIIDPCNKNNNNNIFYSTRYFMHRKTRMRQKQESRRFFSIFLIIFFIT